MAAQAGQRGAARAGRRRRVRAARVPAGRRVAGGGAAGRAADAPPSPDLLDEALSDIEGHLGFLAEVEPGSNAWAVSGRRTAHGGAVICNDSHRALDTPNVYWQSRVTCPDFDVTGATFPGLPGFPHFGFNGSVAWAITHGDADTQDLYLERFDGTRYRTPDGWREAEVRHERIERARRLPGHRSGMGHQARAGGARAPGGRPRAGAQVDGNAPAQPRLRVPAAHAHRAHRRRDGRRAGRLGRPGQQPGLRRHRRAHRLPVPWRAARAVVGRGTAAAGPRLVRTPASGRAPCRSPSCRGRSIPRPGS